MNGKAQILFEAMIAFLFLACFLGVALSSMEKQKQETAFAKNTIETEADAQECALLADALFSGTESALKNLNLNCSAGKKFEIKSRQGEKEKTAFCIAGQLKTLQVSGKTFLEVKTSEHYR